MSNVLTMCWSKADKERAAVCIQYPFNSSCLCCWTPQHTTLDTAPQWGIELLVQKWNVCLPLLSKQHYLKLRSFRCNQLCRPTSPHEKPPKRTCHTGTNPMLNGPCQRLRRGPCCHTASAAPTAKTLHHDLIPYHLDAVVNIKTHNRTWHHDTCHTVLFYYVVSTSNQHVQLASLIRVPAAM